MSRQPLAETTSGRAIMNSQANGRNNLLGVSETRSPAKRVSSAGTENQTNTTPKPDHSKTRRGHGKTLSYGENVVPFQSSTASSRRRSMIPVLVAASPAPALTLRQDGLPSVADGPELNVSEEQLQSFAHRLSAAPSTPKSSGSQGFSQIRTSPSAVPVPTRSNSTRRVVSGIKPSKGTVNLRRALLGEPGDGQRQETVAGDSEQTVSGPENTQNKLMSISESPNGQTPTGKLPTEDSARGSPPEVRNGRQHSGRKAHRSSLGLGVDGAPIPDLSQQTQDILRMVHAMSSSRQSSSASGRSPSSSSVQSHGNGSSVQNGGDNCSISLGAHMVLPSNPTNDLVAAANATKRGSATPSSRAINALAAELHLTQSLLESTRSQLRVSQHQQESLTGELARVKEGRDSLRKEIESLERTLERKERIADDSKQQAASLERQMEGWETERGRMRNELEKAQTAEAQAMEQVKEVRSAYAILDKERRQDAVAMAKDVRSLTQKLADLDIHRQNDMSQLRAQYDQLVAKHRKRESTRDLLERLHQARISEVEKDRDVNSRKESEMSSQIMDLQACLASATQDMTAQTDELNKVRDELKIVLAKIRVAQPA